MGKKCTKKGCRNHGSGGDFYVQFLTFCMLKSGPELLIVSTAGDENATGEFSYLEDDAHTPKALLVYLLLVKRTHA